MHVKVQLIAAACQNLLRDLDKPVCEILSGCHTVFLSECVIQERAADGQGPFPARILFSR